MRARTTILLLLVCATLGAYVYFYERFQTGTAERERTADLVLALDKSEIDLIRIVRTDGEVLLTKLSEGTSGVWQLSSPIQDRAEQAAVEAILKLASEFKVYRTIPGEDIASGEVNVFDIGLDATNGVQVVFGSDGRELGTLLVGNVAPWSDTVYCKVLDNPERQDIYVGATSARPILIQPAEAFRDTFLAGIQFNDVLGVSIKRGVATDIELRRDRATDDALWELVKPLRTAADSDMLDNMLKRFLKAHVEAFIPLSPEAAPAPSQAAVVLTFHTKGGREATITLEPPSETVPGLAQARASDRDGVFLVNDEFREMFSTSSPSIPFFWQQLRSRKLGRIDPARLTTVVLHRRGTWSVPVWLVGNSWYLKRESGAPELADKGKIYGLVTGLNQQEILEFASDTGEDLEAFGLAEPSIRLEFSTADHSEDTKDPQIAPENTVTLVIGQGKNGRIYAKYQTEPFVYQVEADVLSLLPDDPIKWKDRNLLSLQQSSIQAIRMTRPPDPSLDLIYDTAASKWTATLSGEDVSGLVDTNLVEQLRQRLAVFSADEWDPSFKPLENLRNHTLEIRLIIRNLDDGQPKESTRTLRFAPTVPGRATDYYYGQLEGIPEPFKIKRDTYDRLYSTPLRAKGGAGKPQPEPPQP